MFLIGWLVLYIWDLGKNYSGKSISLNEKKQNIEDAEKDTDNDNLKDWEEILWKTDQLNPDTDSDGALDGDEIKTGRDPKIAGKCDEKEVCSDKIPSPEETTKKSEENSSTLTAKISENLIKNYFAAKNVLGGEPLSANTVQGFADFVSLEIERGFVSYQDIFKKDGLKISLKTNAKDYVNQLGNAFEKNFKNISGSEFDKVDAITKNFLSKNNGGATNENDTKIFDPLIGAYQNMEEFLKKETTPEQYAEIHLLALNIMHNTFLAVRNMKNLEEDPLKAIIGIKLYEKEQERSQEFLKKLKENVKKDGLNFKQGDGGYFFIKYFEQIKN